MWSRTFFYCASLGIFLFREINVSDYWEHSSGKLVQVLYGFSFGIIASSFLRVGVNEFGKVYIHIYIHNAHSHNMFSEAAITKLVEVIFLKSFASFTCYLQTFIIVVHNTKERTFSLKKLHWGRKRIFLWMKINVVLNVWEA